jgi:hypothetical protein
VIQFANGQNLDVRKAWKVDLGTDTVSPVPTKGILDQGAEQKSPAAVVGHWIVREVCHRAKRGCLNSSSGALI